MAEYYEDVDIGTTYRSDHGRTITESDIFSWPTGTQVPIHTDREFVRKQTQYDDVLPQNSLIMGTIANLQSGSSKERPPALAMYGKDNYRFPNPIYPGDTVYTKSEVINKRTVDEKSGIIRYEVELRNQDDELTAIGENLVLVPRRLDSTS